MEGSLDAEAERDPDSARYPALRAQEAAMSDTITTTIRIDRELWERAKDVARRISARERRQASVSELVRRGLVREIEESEGGATTTKGGQNGD